MVSALQLALVAVNVGELSAWSRVRELMDPHRLHVEMLGGRIVFIVSIIRSEQARAGPEKRIMCLELT